MVTVDLIMTVFNFCIFHALIRETGHNAPEIPYSLPLLSRIQHLEYIMHSSRPKVADLKIIKSMCPTPTASITLSSPK